MATTPQPRPTFTPRPAPSGRWPASAFMPVRCSGCRHLYECEVPVNAPLDDFVTAYRTAPCPSCGLGEPLPGQGRTWAEDAAYPQGGPIDERIALWLENGEPNGAAEAILDRMAGRPGTRKAHPRDDGDLRACFLLLRRIPEWSDRIGEMAGVSRAWARVADRWTDLFESLHDEGGFDVEGRPAPRTRALLDAINVGR